MAYVSSYDVLSIWLTPLIAIYCILLVAIMGLVMGSALNCLSWRIANHKKWSKGRSCCVSCGHELTRKELIPVISWLCQKGKCRHCGAPISIRYPITEAILCVTYVCVLLRFDLSIETLLCLILCSCLFCLSLVDMDTMEIPNRFLVIPAITRIVYALFMGGLSEAWYCVWHALILGGGILVLALIMDKIFKKESMGGGDIKLLAMLGLYFNLPECFLLLIFACIFGIILAMTLGVKKGIAFPFGPAISVAAFVVLMIGAPITQWYLGLFM